MSKGLQLTPEEKKELIFILHNKYHLSGREIAKIEYLGLKKSMIYKILKSK